MLEQPPKMKSPNSKTEIRKPRYVFSLRISDFMLGIFAGRLPLAGFCGAVLLVSGCVTTGPLDWVRNGFKVGPNYARPPAPVADEWIEAKNPNVQNRHLQDWWTVFQDPTLNSLIDTSYDQNLTLRVAGTRVLQARPSKRSPSAVFFLKANRRRGNIVEST